MTPRKIFILLNLCVMAISAGLSASDFAPVVSGRVWNFPSDHGAHPDFKTEWWYFTGHLESEAGRRFGFQWTVFRSALLKPGERPAGTSAWRARDLYFGHLAISDLGAKKFYYGESAARGALGLAASATEGFQVKLPGFSGSVEGSEIEIKAQGEAIALDLAFQLPADALLHGQSGYSAKSPEAGRASYYYSLPQLHGGGTVEIEGEKFAVRGRAWMDHEFGSSQLAESQTGWDWFGLPLSGRSALMVYRLRNPKQGDYLSGTYVDSQGRAFALASGDIELKSSEPWKSPRSKGEYPQRWEIRIPRFGLELQVKADFADQELATSRSTQITYWEGSVSVSGKVGADMMDSQGYLEMTGYAGEFENKL